MAPRSGSDPGAVRFRPDLNHVIAPGWLAPNDLAGATDAARVADPLLIVSDAKHAWTVPADCFNTSDLEPSPWPAGSTCRRLVTRRTRYAPVLLDELPPPLPQASANSTRERSYVPQPGNDTPVADGHHDDVFRQHRPANRQHATPGLPLAGWNEHVRRYGTTPPQRPVSGDVLRRLSRERRSWASTPVLHGPARAAVPR
jgi:hypothetical protein